jgi:hypothetical protein
LVIKEIRMRILSIEGKELKACFQFEYKGFTVSFSTIYEPEVRIFFTKDGHKQFLNIPEAIKWIDENSKVSLDKLYYPLNHL